MALSSGPVAASLSRVLKGTETAVTGLYPLRALVSRSGATWTPATVGLAVLVVDRQRKATTLRVYRHEDAEPSLPVCTLSAELYFQLRYLKLGPAFHALELEDGVMLGLQFEHDEAAEHFYSKLQLHAPTREKYGVDDASASAGSVYLAGNRMSITASSLPSATTPHSRASFSHSTSDAFSGIAAPTASSGSGIAFEDAGGGGGARRGTRRSSLIGKMKSLWQGDRRSGEDADKPIGEMEISSVVSGTFKHEGHVGLTAEGTFDISNIPAEWKQCFRSLGVSKKELQSDPDFARTLCNLMANERVVERTRAQAIERERLAVLQSMSGSPTASPTSNAQPPAAWTQPAASPVAEVQTSKPRLASMVSVGSPRSPVPDDNPQPVAVRAEAAQAEVPPPLPPKQRPSGPPAAHPAAAALASAAATETSGPPSAHAYAPTMIVHDAMRGESASSAEEEEATHTTTAATAARSAPPVPARRTSHEPAASDESVPGVAPAASPETTPPMLASRGPTPSSLLSSIQAFDRRRLSTLTEVTSSAAATTTTAPASSPSRAPADVPLMERLREVVLARRAAATAHAAPVEEEEEVESDWSDD